MLPKCTRLWLGFLTRITTCCDLKVSFARKKLAVFNDGLDTSMFLAFFPKIIICLEIDPKLGGLSKASAKAKAIAGVILAWQARILNRVFLEIPKRSESFCKFKLRG